MGSTQWTTSNGKKCTEREMVTKPGAKLPVTRTTEKCTERESSGQNPPSGTAREPHPTGEMQVRESETKALERERERETRRRGRK